MDIVDKYDNNRIRNIYKIIDGTYFDKREMVTY